MRKAIIVAIATTLLCVLCSPAFANEKDDALAITVNFSTFTLKLTNTQGEVLATYPVALPKPAETPRLPAYGYVNGIEQPAWWRPTARSIAYYRTHKKIALPAAVPPGHRLNAMGDAKILVTYTTSGTKPTARIHGTNEPSSIGKRASGGCIRMHNKDILDLIAHIRGHRTTVTFVKQ